MTNRSKFTPEEDQKLIYIVSSSPEVKWSKVAELMKNKTSRQCRERYKNYLANGINQSPWTSEEDQILLKAYSEIGPCWSHMTNLFQGRTCVNIKNHYAKIKGKLEKIDNFDANLEETINPVDNIAKNNNQVTPTGIIANINHSNTNNINNGCNVGPYLFKPSIPQIPINQPIKHVFNVNPIEKSKTNTVCNANEHQVNSNSATPNNYINSNVIYDCKYLTRKQQLFQQLQLQQQQQIKQADVSETQENNGKKGPLYVLPFFGEQNKLNFINLRMKNEPKKCIEQEFESPHPINFYDNDQDILEYSHQITSLSDTPSLMLSANNISTNIDSPMYEPDSFVEHDDLSAIYDFSHDYNDYNTCQDALFIPLG
ncbi:hypothetical protein M9Y10_027401 [Tritrichomonas musculus]|uniref:Myb-like DNA-binding domain containing protein n=1 Tax=Tritrichomonas musculus TaxID=1915356 RepID=A0ABR2H5K7_9EUKA